MGTRTFAVLFACLIVSLVLPTSQAEAQTRRAFLVGNQDYKDGNIQQLKRSANDARDLAKDLEELGFDKKNVRVVLDVKNKSAFDKEFEAFLKTIETGDLVFFYFSGHGVGVEAEQNNYLLFTDVKSPFAYARSQFPEKERKNSDVIRVRMAQYLDAYTRDEIPLGGVSTKEIEQRLYDRRPKTVLMVVDACRSLVRSENEGDEAKSTRLSSGSRLFTRQTPQRNFIILYSAAFGEQAVESLSPQDPGRNSLFTEVLRSEIMRPGQSLKDLAERVKLMVRATARDYGEQQEPEYIYDGPNPDETYLIEPIGADRFQMSKKACDGDEADWKEIRYRRKRSEFEAHIRRFDICPTAQLARQRLSELGLSADDSDAFQDRCLEGKDDWEEIKRKRGEETPAQHVGRLATHIQRYDGCATAELARRYFTVLSPELRKVANLPDDVTKPRNVELCDLLAASDLDRDRPPNTGLPFEKVVADDAIEACKALVEDRNTALNPRFQFNLARAYHKRGNNLTLSSQERLEALDRARLSYLDAVRRGYVIALGHLAVLLEEWDGRGSFQEQAIQLLKRGAEQRQPHAMYILGLRFRYGQGVERDLERALELFRSAAEGGIVAAKVEAGEALIKRRPNWVFNARAGVALLTEAAEAGSTRAQMLLAQTYMRGAMVKYRSEKAVNQVRPDPALALIWLGRLAEAGDGQAQALLADRMQTGEGLSAPQPEAAERYWRLAAQTGNAEAQVTFADRMRRGFVLVKPEFGSGHEGIRLLSRAMSQGSAQAALALAQIYRTGELGEKANPKTAVMHAFKSMELAALSDAPPKIGEPFPEIAAAHLLAEMVKSDEAGDMLTTAEVERLERFYGKVDSSGKQVKIRRLVVTLVCGFGEQRYDKRTKEYRYDYSWPVRAPIWVWDWGRAESPTEFQFRSLERDTGCSKNSVLRRTLIDVYEQAKNNEVAFADLVEQKIKTAMGASMPTNTREGKRRGRRR